MSQPRPSTPQSSTFACGLCLESYNTSNHKPYSLVPCGHTLCIQCHDSLGKTVCPYCRTDFTDIIPNWEIMKHLPLDPRAPPPDPPRRTKAQAQKPPGLYILEIDDSEPADEQVWAERIRKLVLEQRNRQERVAIEQYNSELLCPMVEYSITHLREPDLDVLLLGDDPSFKCVSNSFILNKLHKICSRFNLVQIEMPTSERAQLWGPLAPVLRKLSAEERVDNFVSCDARLDYYAFCVNKFGKERPLPNRLIPENFWSSFQMQLYRDDRLLHTRRAELLEVAYQFVIMMEWMLSFNERTDIDLMVMFFRERKEFVDDRLVAACLLAYDVLKRANSGRVDFKVRDDKMRIMLSGSPADTQSSSVIVFNLKNLQQEMNSLTNPQLIDLLRGFFDHFMVMPALEYKFVHNLLVKARPKEKILGILGWDHVRALHNVLGAYFSEKISTFTVRSQPEPLLGVLKEAGVFDESWADWMREKLGQTKKISLKNIRNVKK